MSEEYPLFNTSYRIYKSITNNNYAIVLLCLIVLFMIYFLPVYSLLFITSIFVSIIVGLSARYALNSGFLQPIGFTPVEQGIIGGFISGSTGFIIGNITSNYLRKSITWGYAYKQQQKRIADLMDELRK